MKYEMGRIVSDAWCESSLKIESGAGFRYEQFCGKANYPHFREQVAKLAWNRGWVGNSKERKMAPISGRQ
jgi:hypothetical protein